MCYSGLLLVYLDGWVSRVFLKKCAHMFVEVVGHANMMMLLRCIRNNLTVIPLFFREPCPYATKSSFTTFNACQLFDKLFLVCTLVPSFCCTMFQLTLHWYMLKIIFATIKYNYLQVQLSMSLLSHTCGWCWHNHRENDAWQCECWTSLEELRHSALRLQKELCLIVQPFSVHGVSLHLSPGAAHGCWMQGMFAQRILRIRHQCAQSDYPVT